MKTAADGKGLVIIGTGETAAFVFEYFSYDSVYEVAAFSAESSYITSDLFCGRPVVPLDQLAITHPPTEYRTFVAVSMTDLNRVRRRLYNAAKAAGFECASYACSKAFVAESAQLGDNVFIQEFSSLQHNVRIGNNVFIGGGTFIGHSSVVEDDCFFGPDVTVCGFAKIGRSSFLGAKSCIADEISVAEDCVIGAGGVVLRNTTTRQVYLGNPARPTGRDSLEGIDEH